jgi:predicted homoserine dehydrogenase-like protein
VNLSTMLLQREAEGRPVTIGLIGAGKFGTMFLAQLRRTRGMHLVALADLDLGRARAQLRAAEWSDDAFAASSFDDAVAASSFDDAVRTRATRLTDDADALIACSAILRIRLHRAFFRSGLRATSGSSARSPRASSYAGPMSTTTATISR